MLKVFLQKILLWADVIVGGGGGGGGGEPLPPPLIKGVNLAILAPK